MHSHFGSPPRVRVLNSKQKSRRSISRGWAWRHRPYSKGALYTVASNKRGSLGHSSSLGPAKQARRATYERWSRSLYRAFFGSYRRYTGASASNRAYELGEDIRR